MYHLKLPPNNLDIRQKQKYSAIHFHPKTEHPYTHRPLNVILIFDKYPNRSLILRGFQMNSNRYNDRSATKHQCRKFSLEAQVEVIVRLFLDSLFFPESTNKPTRQAQLHTYKHI